MGCSAGYQGVDLFAKDEFSGSVRSCFFPQNSLLYSLLLGHFLDQEASEACASARTHLYPYSPSGSATVVFHLAYSLSLTRPWFTTICFQESHLPSDPHMWLLPTQGFAFRGSKKGVRIQTATGILKFIRLSRLTNSFQMSLNYQADALKGGTFFCWLRSKVCYFRKPVVSVRCLCIANELELLHNTLFERTIADIDSFWRR